MPTKRKLLARWIRSIRRGREYFSVPYLPCFYLSNENADTENRGNSFARNCSARDGSSRCPRPMFLRFLRRSQISRGKRIAWHSATFRAALRAVAERTAREKRRRDGSTAVDPASFFHGALETGVSSPLREERRKTPLAAARAIIAIGEIVGQLSR